MKLYIQIENGQPVNHPAFESNLIDAFGSVPGNWEPFVRLTAPALNPYEKNQTVSYQKVNGVWTDVFSCEQMTQEEITAKQDAVKAVWIAIDKNYPSWTFDDVKCEYVAPVAKPDEVNPYAWRESDLSWVFVPAAPQGEGWAFNVETGVWEKV